MVWFAKKFLLYKGNNRQKADVIWNILGSGVYAAASMVLAFVVMRLAGEDDGGIFSLGFSALGQQLFIVAYFGIRPFQITDGKKEYSFGDYLNLRFVTVGLAVLIGALYLTGMTVLGPYSPRKAVILFLLVVYKVIDGFADVYESEFQRQGCLYLTGKSNTFRTILSVTCFLISFQIGKSLTFACGAAVAAQAAGVVLFNLSVMKAGILPSVDYNVRKEKTKSLFLNTDLLFLSVFLDFFVFSAAKYAIDYKMNDAMNGYFNIIFMPTSVIYLVANFSIRPFLTRLTDCWNEKNYKEFTKISRKIGGVIAGLTVLAGILAIVLGPWALGIMELLLGEHYKGMLVRFSLPFTMIIIGGGLYALANLSYYLLVIMRKQNLIFWIYFLGAAVGAVLSFTLVGGMGITGAALSYLLLMAGLAAGFTVCQLILLNKAKEEAL